nr:hypothetical protein [Bacillus atrophaeus]
MTDNIDVYGHLYPNKQKEMADKLENLPQVSGHFWSQNTFSLTKGVKTLGIIDAAERT